MKDNVKPRVAIACQGGGSHAAFAAGVLRGLLRPQTFDRFQLTALSGTSGGAMCAALAWSKLVLRSPDSAAERAELASAALAGFWEDLCCDSFGDLARKMMTPALWQALTPQRYADSLLNSALMWTREHPVAIQASPYWFPEDARNRLERLLRKHARLEAISGYTKQRLRRPALFIGVTDITYGLGLALGGEEIRGNYDLLVASAAVPPLYRAVVDDKGRAHWDGLFSRNPPVREFTNLDLDERPDEIWVIQVTPQVSPKVPTTPQRADDRRTELTGNLALGQELYQIDKINRLLDEYELVPKKPGQRPGAGRYKPITLRVVGLDRDVDMASYYDRSRELIEGLMELGESRSAEFFERTSLWKRPPRGRQDLAAVSPREAEVVRDARGFGPDDE
jgi:NTE family protein